MTVLSPELESTYEVLDTMGGGMGAVYKVRHRLFGEIRIIKVMQAALKDDSSLRERFATEAKRGKQLKHRNIAQVQDFQIGSDGNAYLIMEFIDGVNLREAFLRTGQPLDPRTVVAIGEQTLAALGYLHARNLIHRDISPDNLMVTRDEDGCLLVKLIDLGIAKSLEDNTIALTRVGDFMGKLSYASPEQFGEKVDSRSDFYSLSIVLYELLTRFKPITAANTGAFVLAHYQTPPRPFSETDPTGRIPEALRRVVLKALEKKPENRYQTADEFASALHATLLAGDMPPATPSTAGLPPPPASTLTLTRTDIPRATLPPAQAVPLPTSLPQPQPWNAGVQPTTVRTTTPTRSARQSPWLFVAIAAAAVLIGVLGILAFEGLRNRWTSSITPTQSPTQPTASDGTTAGRTIEVPSPQPRPLTTTRSNGPASDTNPVIVEPTSTTPASTSALTTAFQSSTNPPKNVEVGGTASATTGATTSSAAPFKPDLAEGERQRKQALAFSNAHLWQNAVNAWRPFIREYSGVNAAADHAAYYNLGVALESLQNWREAADAYEQAARTNNGDSDTNNLVRLARCYGKLGRWNDAAEAYERVLRLDPQNEVAKRNLPLALQQVPRGR
jgi:eukaryotic-like serine/threonine-protein kinase